MNWLSETPWLMVGLWGMALFGMFVLIASIYYGRQDRYKDLQENPNDPKPR